MDRPLIFDLQRYTFCYIIARLQTYNSCDPIMFIRSAKDYIEAKNNLLNEFPWLNDHRFILNIMPGHMQIARGIFSTMDRFFHPETFSSISMLTIQLRCSIWVYFPELLSKQDSALIDKLSFKYGHESDKACSVCGRPSDTKDKKSPSIFPFCSEHIELFSSCKSVLDVIRKIEKTNKIKSNHDDYFGGKPKTLVLSKEKYYVALNKLIKKHPWAANITGIDDFMPGSLPQLENFLRLADKLVNHNKLNAPQIFDVSLYSGSHNPAIIKLSSPNDTNAPRVIASGVTNSNNSNIDINMVNDPFASYIDRLPVDADFLSKSIKGVICERETYQQAEMIDYENLRPGFKEIDIFRDLWLNLISNINSSCKICGDNSGGDYCKDHQHLSSTGSPFLYFKHVEKMSSKDVSLLRSNHKASFSLVHQESTPHKTQRLFDIDLLDQAVYDIKGDEAHYVRNLSLALAKARKNQFQRVGQLHNHKSILDEFIAIFPNFSELHTMLKGSFSLSMMGDERVAFPPVLLVGEPGIGKTEASRWLAEKLNVGFHKIDMTSISNTSSITGTERHWNTGSCGIIFKMLAHGDCINPVVLLDEMDKGKETHNGDPYAPFHTLLEQSSAREFSDAFVRDLPINAGMINWIASANDIHNIPETILSRFTEIRVPAPTADQKRQVIRSIYSKLLRENSWGKKVGQSLSDDAIEQLMLCPSPRILQSIMLRAIGEAVSGGGKAITTASISKVISWSEKRSIGFH